MKYDRKRDCVRIRVVIECSKSILELVTVERKGIEHWYKGG